MWCCLAWRKRMCTSPLHSNCVPPVRSLYKVRAHKHESKNDPQNGHIFGFVTFLIFLHNVILYGRDIFWIIFMSSPTYWNLAQSRCMGCICWFSSPQFQMVQSLCVVVGEKTHWTDEQRMWCCLAWSSATVRHTTTRYFYTQNLTSFTLEAIRCIGYIYWFSSPQFQMAQSLCVVVGEKTHWTDEQRMWCCLAWSSATVRHTTTRYFYTQNLTSFTLEAIRCIGYIYWFSSPQFQMVQPLCKWLARKHIGRMNSGCDVV